MLLRPRRWRRVRDLFFTLLFPLCLAATLLAIAWKLNAVFGLPGRSWDITFIETQVIAQFGDLAELCGPRRIAASAL